MCFVHNLVNWACCRGEKFLMRDFALLCSARLSSLVFSALCIDSMRLWVAAASPEVASCNFPAGVMMLLPAFFTMSLH